MLDTKIDLSKLIRQPTWRIHKIEDVWDNEVIDRINDWLRQNRDREFVSVSYKSLSGLGTVYITYREQSQS